MYICFMKRFVFSLIMLMSLAFSSVGYANPDVITKKADDTSIVMQADTQVELYGVYEIVKLNAPEVFKVGKTATKVYLYGEKKAEAFTYLTKEKQGKNIYIGKNTRCYEYDILAVEICKPDKLTLNYKYNKKENTRLAKDTKTLSGANVKIAKKWVWYI